MANDILLESGTNEVEVLEFFLGEQSFGINVAKIAQIVPFVLKNLTVLPNDEKSIRGTFLWHNQTIPLIDLSQVLHKKPFDEDSCARPIVLVTEFNNVINGFLIDGVSRIYRISWDEISPLSPFLDKYSASVTGSIQINSREILLLDFEFVIAELFPETKMSYHDIEVDKDRTSASRHKQKIIFAEDSPFIRTTIVDLLNKSGYTQVETYDNGEDALMKIRGLQIEAAKDHANISDYMNLIISDIEMPKMDGLTLCRQVKMELGLTETPIIIFSSLVNEQMIQKCKEVGADGYTTKPQINALVSLMDKNLGLTP